MQRVEGQEDSEQAVIVTAAEFERDWQRGYAIAIWEQAKEEIIKDPRSGVEIRRPVTAILMYNCMRCKFNSLSETVAVEHNQVQAEQEFPHPWLFDPFTNPYGHFMDVQIEGIDAHGYAEFVKEKTKNG